MVRFPDVNSLAFQRRVEKRDFVFDNKNVNWYPRDDDNKFFLRQYAKMFTDRLHAQGYLFTNDVLNSLGIKPTTGGQMSGWLLTNTRPVKFGAPEANFVDIRITQTRYNDGVPVEYFLHLNHDGLILFDALDD